MACAVVHLMGAAVTECGGFVVLMAKSALVLGDCAVITHLGSAAGVAVWSVNLWVDVREYANG
jgi:hypothetical protein